MRKLILLFPFVLILGCDSMQVNTEIYGEESVSDSDENKIYTFEDLEEVNNNEIIVQNTPTYTRFINNDSINLISGLRSDLLELDNFSRIDSTHYWFENDSLIIRRIYFSEGKCVNFLPTFEFSDSFISINTPVIIRIDPQEYFEKSDYGFSSCELANIVDLRISLKVCPNDRNKSVLLNGQRIK